MPAPGGVMVLRSGCALGVVLGVKVVRVVGDGVAVVVRPDAVRVVAAHGVKVVRVVGDGVAVVVRHDVVRGRGCPWVRSCSDRGEGVAVGVASLLTA